MTKDPDSDRFVLRRGRTEHDWRGSTPPIAPTEKPATRPRVRLPSIPRPTLPHLVPAFVAAGLAAVLFLAFLVVSFHAFKAEGKSMEPDLHDGDRLIVARILYEEVDFGLLDWLPGYDSSDLRWGSPGRGDVVVFDSPVRDERLVKRVIGMPGDTIDIHGGDVYVNGERLDEPYAKGDTACLQTCETLLVPEGAYFVLGDNRVDSVDSRQGWTVPRDEISGKVIFAY